MSQFNDLDEFFDPSLHLPVRGKTYTIQPVDGKTGVWVQRLFQLGAKAAGGQVLDPEALASLQLDDDQERDAFSRVLGDTLEEMLADKVGWEDIKLVGTTALIWVASDTDTAATFWNNGGDTPKARKQPQDRKAGAKSARQGSTGTKSTPTKPDKVPVSAKSSPPTGT